MSGRSRPKPRTLGGAVLALVVAFGVWLVADQDEKKADNDSPPRSVPAATVDTGPRDTTASATAGTTATTDVAGTTAALADGIARIAVADLPREARDTLELIDADGPFPYRQDGQEFQNREGILPDRPPGYYREYTVDTPGSDDRGARRIITGDDGEIYYTDDHYDSFRTVEQ